MIENHFWWLVAILVSSLLFCLYLLADSDASMPHIIHRNVHSFHDTISSAHDPDALSSPAAPEPSSKATDGRPDYVDEDVLVYHDDSKLLNFWMRDGPAKDKAFNRVYDCPLVRSCRVTFREDEANSADAILVMGGRPDKLRKTRVHTGKPVVAVVTEADQEGSCPSYMKQFGFDYRLSYKASADVWAPLECKSTLAMLNGELDRYIPTFQQREKNVLAMISNCDPRATADRNKWVEGLMDAGLQIDHYGACGRWKNHEEDMSLGKDSQERKRKLAEQYRFVISFENKVEQDYVTEKPFDAYTSGAIPIYWGAPNVDDYLPAGSFVDRRKFPTPRALADFINDLIQNPEKQMPFKNWDKEAYRRTKYGQSCQYPSKCIVCYKAVSEWRENPGKSSCHP